MMESIYYQKGANMVTARLFKTARKTYRISDIEKINLRRPVFWGAVPLAIACYYLVYWHPDHHIQVTNQ